MKKIILASLLVLVSINAQASRLTSNSTNLSAAYVACPDDKCKLGVLVKRDKAIERNEKKLAKQAQVTEATKAEIEALRNIK